MKALMLRTHLQTQGRPLRTQVSGQCGDKEALARSGHVCSQPFRSSGRGPLSEAQSPAQTNQHEMREPAEAEDANEDAHRC